MKKTILTLALAAFSLWTLSGQTMYDAMTFSRNTYYGTARTLGMGNAVTAIGGDMGTIPVNPAGGSVSLYSQFVFSAGATGATTNSSYAPSYNSYNQNAEYTGSFRENKTRMTLPSAGLNMCFDTGERYGIRSWNFGFMVNRSQTYNEVMSALGSEGHTSITGAMAVAAAGMPADILGNASKYDAGYKWNPLCAYSGGMIQYNSADNAYFGSAETVSLNEDGSYGYEVCGWLKQRIGTTTLGSKHDIVFNYGFNVNDRFFFGASLNCPVINYKYSEYYREDADDPADFPVTQEYWDKGTGAFKKEAPTNYLGSTYSYSSVCDISGINLKIGAIWLPSDGLRVGAAFQTPTAYTVHEKWFVDISSEFADSGQNLTAGTPTAESTYNFRAPYSANFGIAYTFGRGGLVSFDYELVDFSVMRFSEETPDEFYSYEDPFYRVNRLNKLFCGVQHSVRAGAEMRVLPFLSLRAGLNLTTNPERHYTDNTGLAVYAGDYDALFSEFENGTYRIIKNTAEYNPDLVWAFSCGAGFVSEGSFYADIALRRTSLPDQYYKPYSTYLNQTVDGKIYDTVSPTVKTTRSLVDAVLTLGWRF